MARATLATAAILVMAGCLLALAIPAAAGDDDKYEERGYYKGVKCDDKCEYKHYGDECDKEYYDKCYVKKCDYYGKCVLYPKYEYCYPDGDDKCEYKKDYTPCKYDDDDEKDEKDGHYYKKYDDYKKDDKKDKDDKYDDKDYKKKDDDDKKKCYESYCYKGYCKRFVKKECKKY